MARGAARAVAALGIPAASLVSPVAPAAPAAAGPAYTRAELDAMPGMARLRLLREHPALAARYMNS